MGTELPSVTPMFRLRIKSGGMGYTEAPPDILECEKAVCKVDPDERQILIIRYQRQFFPSEMAETFHVSRSQAYRWLERAEWAVHVQLGS